MSPQSAQPILNWGDRTRWQTGSSQQILLLFRETSALRAPQWALRTLGNPPPALGSPEMQLMHWGDTREDRDDDQGAEIFDVWGQSWVWGALREESYNHLTGQEESQALHRTGYDEDKLKWERCLKTSSKSLLSPTLDKTPSEVPQQPASCCLTKPNGCHIHNYRKSLICLQDLLCACLVYTVTHPAEHKGRKKFSKFLSYLTWKFHSVF